MSSQAHNRERLAEWKQRVRDAAAAAWPSGKLPLSERLRLVVTYFHERETVSMDNDNMVKPIQDALIGLIYEDDRQVVQVDVRKSNLDGEFRVRRMPLVLGQAFSQGDEFLYVRIESEPYHAEFL